MLAGRILTPQGWVTGTIEFGQRIGRIAAAPADTGLTILPGFIDLHVHGAAGVDIMRGGDAGAVVAREHARHGTTSLLGTTMTAHEPAKTVSTMRYSMPSSAHATGRLKK